MVACRQENEVPYWGEETQHLVSMPYQYYLSKKFPSLITRLVMEPDLYSGPSCDTVISALEGMFRTDFGPFRGMVTLTSVGQEIQRQK